MKIGVTNNEILFNGEMDEETSFIANASGAYSLAFQVFTEDEDVDWSLLASDDGETYVEIDDDTITADSSAVISVFKPEFQYYKLTLTPADPTDVLVREYKRTSF